MKKVLLITRNAWNDANSTGSTASNLFQDFKKEDLANIYCRNEEISNSKCGTYYNMTEKDILNSILKKTQVGKIVSNVNNYNSNKKVFDDNNKKYAIYRKFRFTIFLWIREFIWLIPTWKNQNLLKFIDEVNPDIIYMPLYDSIYMYRILFFILKHSKTKLVLFTGDDVYSLKQYSLSPLFWINRLVTRLFIKKGVDKASLIYCLTNEQKEEYEKYFNKSFIRLTKSTEDSTNSVTSNRQSDIKVVTYLGNLNAGRFDTLVDLGKIIDRNILPFRLEVYCNSTLSKQQYKKLQKYKSIVLNKPVSAGKIQDIQKQSNYLLHLESFKLKKKLETRLSFSTKITDYMGSGVPIIAIGWHKSAAMRFIEKNNLGYTITNLNQINEVFQKMDLESNDTYIENCKELIRNDFSKDKVTINFTRKINEL